MSAPLPIQTGETTIVELSKEQAQVMYCVGTITLEGRSLPLFQVANKPMPHQQACAEAIRLNAKRDPADCHDLSRHMRPQDYEQVETPHILWVKRVLDDAGDNFEYVRQALHRGGPARLTWALKAIEGAIDLTENPEAAKQHLERLQKEGLGEPMEIATSSMGVAPEDQKWIYKLWEMVGDMIGSAHKVADQILKQCEPLGWTHLYIEQLLQSIKPLVSNETRIDDVAHAVRQREEIAGWWNPPAQEVPGGSAIKHNADMVWSIFRNIGEFKAAMSLLKEKRGGK